MKAKWFVRFFFVSFVLLVLAALASQNATVNAQATKAATMAATGPVAPPASKMRWDIISVAFAENKQTLSAGGVAFASANDGSYIKFTGSGTFGPGVSDPVSGGGDWGTWDAGNRPTGSGKYTVVGFAGFDWAPGKPSPIQIDQIGKLEDFSGGVATLRIAYTNADGSPAGTGTLIISCHPPAGGADSVVEGVIGSKGATLFYNPAHIAPNVDQGRDNFHFIR
jgi:hypothetical protein